MDRYIGKRLDGRYIIREVIGVGGMAVVFKAFDEKEQRIVAIKVLKQEYLANEDFKRRFKNESRAVAMLSHPNIVKVYDVGLSNELQYIVMEYIDGITLKNYIEQEKIISWKSTVHFVSQVLHALSHAHDKGIVHRDIKPQNIMLLKDGTIKVTDFGIARFSRSGTRTITDKAIGSVHYISPEQARGAYVDDKTDIYSVGVMMYEMLTGHVPFDAESPVSVAIMQMQADPKSPRELNPDIPEGLEQITRKAMQKDPALRYQSAAEMLRDIERFKKNPSIQFEYRYFGEEPNTKYVDAINQVKNTPDYSGYDKRHSPLVPIISAVACALLLILAGVGLYIADYFGVIDIPGIGVDQTGKSENSVVVPNLLGQTLDQVLNDETIGGHITYEEVYDSTYPSGQVCYQSPSEGVTIDLNIRKIIVKISRGAETAEMPDVAPNDGKPLVEAAALTLLRQNGFHNLNVVKETSSTVEKGYAIRTDPAAYTISNINSKVTLYVSAGKGLATMEDLTGMTVEYAREILAAIGLNIDEDNIAVVDGGLAEGLIVAQSVPAETEVEVGTIIKVSVSSGKSVKRPYTISIDLSYFTNLGYTDVELKYYVDYQQITGSVSSYSVLDPSVPPVEYVVEGNAELVFACRAVTYRGLTTCEIYERTWRIDFSYSDEDPIVTDEGWTYIPTY